MNGQLFSGLTKTMINKTKIQEKTKKKKKYNELEENDEGEDRQDVFDVDKELEERDCIKVILSDQIDCIFAESILNRIHTVKNFKENNRKDTRYFVNGLSF